MSKKLQTAMFKLLDIFVILTMVLGAPLNVFAAPQAQALSPTLVSDKGDYTPGESAQITGSGFSAGEYVLAADGPDGRQDWGSVTADVNGGFETDSPALDSAGSYEVRAYASDWSGDWEESPVASETFAVTAPPDPSATPTEEPTAEPTSEPTNTPTTEPTAEPTQEPTLEPTATSTTEPTNTPTSEPTNTPTPSGPPTIVSDKADYAPGELVTLTGGNWQPGELVHIFVNDDVGQSWSHNSDPDPVADGNGSFTYQFELPDLFVATYTVKATGATSGTAMTTFTDSIPNNVSMVTWRTSGSGAWIQGTLNQNNSNYKEGETVPFRIELGILATSGNPYSAAICRDYQNGTVFGYTTLLPFNTSRAATPGGTITSSSAAGAWPAGTFQGVNITITGVTETGGPGACGSTQRETIVTFNATGSGPQYLLWGGRLASPSDPGVGAGNSASFYPGGSLQMRLQSPDKTAGINPSGIIQLATLTVTKVVDNGSATPDQWCFTVTGPNGFNSTQCVPSGQSSVSFVGLNSGSYTVTESTVLGYAFASGSGTNCTFNGSTATATVTAAAGGATNASCTFHNALADATLIVIKHVVNDNGGTAVAGDFTMSVTGANPSPASFAGAESPGTSVTLTPGSYSVSETGPSGYTASYSADCTGTIAAGETKTCTVTNDDQAATLIVIKHVINDNGGTADASDFILDSGGANDSPDNFAGAEAPGTTVALDAGAYNVTETGPSGYTASFSADCSGSISNGQTKTCTVTNDDNAATLIVIKHVVNDNGGLAGAGDFTMSITGTNPSPASFAGEEAPGTSVTLDAGSYNITETGPSGYTASFSADCAGTIANGETKTCTVTNDDQAAHLKLVKVVVNDNGGGASATDFTLSAAGPTPISGAGGAESDVDAGTYSLSETGPLGYTASSWSCVGGTQSGSDITLANGESATCTITNDDNAPSLTLVKVVVNDDGGTAVTTDFMLSANGPTPISGAGGATSGADFEAGTYDLSETSVPGYTASDWDCVGGTQDDADTITLGLGQSATCTITNDDQAATLIVIKHVINDNGGTAGASDFTMSVTGGNIQPSASFPGAEAPGTTVTLNAGSYSVSESSVPGYTSDGGSADCSGTIANGETKTCTFTNNDDAPSLTLVKVVVNDNGGTALTTAFTLSADGPTPISGAGGATSDATFDAGTYDLSELGPTGYTASDWACAGGNQTDADTVEVGLGEDVTCTITNDDDAPSLTLVKQVINDNGGTAVATDFTLSATGPTPISGAGGASSDATFDAGTYDLSETHVPGYTASDWVCVGGTQGDADTVTVALGQDVTCTITNDDDAPSLTLVKVVVNDNGGAALTTDFTLSASGPTPISGAGGVTSDSTFDAGTYDLSEIGPSGYSASDWVCTGGTQDDADTISLGLGESATCTITNDDRAPSLTLVKAVVNNDGGDAVASEWTLTATGPTGFSGPGPSVSNGASFDAGTYDLTENGPSGYTASAWVCVGGTQGDSDTITVGLGESATCTITNDDIAPTLKLVKVVNNDDGGNAVADDWTLSADAAAPDDGRNFSNAGGSGVFESIFANTVYDLSESIVAGYTAGSWSCDGGSLVGSTVTLAEGETGVTCTITNDDSAPTLMLIKIVVNDDGGNAVVSDFPLFINGDPVTSGVPNTLSANALYTASETNLAGYTASVWGGDCNPDGTITLGEGQSATCTITNDDVAPTLTLIKNVINDDGGNAGPNDFGLSISGNAATSGVAYTLDANALYAIDEVGLTGYTFVDITGDPECPAALGGTVTLDEGQNVTCTISNDDVAPMLTLIKIVVNDDGGDATVSDFPLFIDGNPVTSGAPNTLSANTLYTASETTLAGYTPSTWGGDCNPDGTITLNEGDDKTCTITNDDVAPTLKLVKEVTNDNGGNAVADDWTLSADAAAPSDGRNFSNLGGSGIFETVFANTGYDLSESTVGGYAAGSWFCDGGTLVGSTVTLDEGETGVTCTITNDDVAPTLTVVKVVINDNGGDAGPDDFGLSIGGNPATSGVAYTLSANTQYAIDEAGLSGYTFVDITGDPDCPAVLGGTVTLDEGEDVTCTITNDDQPATLIVIKHVINDNGGTATAGDFTLDSGGVDDIPDDFAGEEAPGTTVTLDAGSYDVTETGPSGYSASFSADCTGSIAVGETKTCTVTNDDVQPQLIVIKHVINENGGTALAGDFTMSVTGSDPSPASFPGAEAPGTAVAINAGNYDVSETGLTGYTASYSVDCTGSIAVGETKTCTVTNDDIAPTLTVVKMLLPNSDTGKFNLQIDGLTKAANVGHNGTTGAVAVNVGMHTVSETAGTGTSLANYVTTIGGDCNPDGTITLALAENKTCTITNARRGTIIVEKQTNPNGAPGSFTFTGDAFGTISDNGQIVVANLAPGIYSSTEADPAASLFALTSIVCSDGSSATPSTGNLQTRTATFNLDPGETVKCTFTNTKDFHAGTIGFWKNWRNHYTSTQFQSLVNYLKENNQKVYDKNNSWPGVATPSNCDSLGATCDDLTIGKVDAIMNVGTKTPREQMILAQFTALKFNLAITQLDGTGGLVQKNDDICLAGTVDVSGISGATAFFGNNATPTIGDVVNAVEGRWTGTLTKTRTTWKWNLTNAQKDMIIKVLTGINEGTIVMSSGCS